MYVYMHIKNPVSTLILAPSEHSGAPPLAHHARFRLCAHFGLTGLCVGENIRTGTSFDNGASLPESRECSYRKTGSDT